MTIIHGLGDRYETIVNRAYVLPVNDRSDGAVAWDLISLKDDPTLDSSHGIWTGGWAVSCGRTGAFSGRECVLGVDSQTKGYERNKALPSRGVASILVVCMIALFSVLIERKLALDQSLLNRWSTKVLKADRHHRWVHSPPITFSARGLFL